MLTKRALKIGLAVLVVVIIAALTVSAITAQGNGNGNGQGRGGGGRGMMQGGNSDNCPMLQDDVDGCPMGMMHGMGMMMRGMGMMMQGGYGYGPGNCPMLEDGGTCPNADNCPFAPDATPETTPQS